MLLVCPNVILTLFLVDGASSLSWKNIFFGFFNVQF